MLYSLAPGPNNVGEGAFEVTPLLQPPDIFKDLDCLSWCDSIPL